MANFLAFARFAALKGDEVDHQIKHWNDHNNINGFHDFKGYVSKVSKENEEAAW